MPNYQDFLHDFEVRLRAIEGQHQLERGSLTEAVVFQEDLSAELPTIHYQLDIPESPLRTNIHDVIVECASMNGYPSTSTVRYTP
jgi:hypothetical protein